MAKTRVKTKQMPMSIAALMSLRMTLVELVKDFNRVTSIGGGFVGDGKASAELE